MTDLKRQRWQRRILWVSWLTYASLYLGRVNIAVALPALQAALRETREECGLDLDPEMLVDLGRLAYRARKDLHLFGARLPRIDTRTLHCESRFTDGASGRRLPEMDDFGWFRFEQLPQLCTRKLAAVLCEQLDLPALVRQLRARAEMALAA